MGGGSSKKKVVQNNDVMVPVVPATTNAVNAENQPEVEQQMSAFDEVTTEAAEDIVNCWKDKIMWVFTKYDRDCSGSLDVNEVLELMVEIQSVTNDSLVNSVKFTFKDSQMVLENLDTDGNGTVEKNEFIDWLSKGLAMTPDQFERYMRSGDSQHLLAIFLLGVKLYCEIEYVEVEEASPAEKEEETSRSPAVEPFVEPFVVEEEIQTVMVETAPTGEEDAPTEEETTLCTVEETAPVQESAVVDEIPEDVKETSGGDAVEEIIAEARREAVQ